MQTLQVLILGLYERIAGLEGKLHDLSQNTEETYKKPISIVGGGRDRSLINSIDIKAGMGQILGGSIVWNTSEIGNIPINAEPPIPDEHIGKGYNKHSHSRFSGGALIKDTIEIVEYDFITTPIINKHSQQFWVTQPSIKKEINSKGQSIDKIGILDLVFNTDTGTWGTPTYEIDVKKCYLVERDENGNIVLDSKGQEKKSLLYNEDTNKTSILWDENAGCFRFLAVYARRIIMSKCPYCYRNLGTWVHDPILLPNGSKYKWNSDTELIEESDIEQREYKGIYQVREDEIIELQTSLKDLEEDYIEEIDRTIFSPLNTSGKFQITGKHLKEMRDSIVKLLALSDSTLTDYFNYDEDRNHILCPKGDKLDWTEPITEDTDLQNFQIKAIHIEDLRHVITPSWIETFDNDGLIPNRVIYNESRDMFVWATQNPYVAWAEIDDGLQPNLYGKYNWTPNYEELITFPQGISIVGAGGMASGSAAIVQENSKLKIDMNVSVGEHNDYQYQVGIGLLMWWVTNPHLTVTSPGAINNMKFQVDGLIVTGGEVGFGLKVNITYRNNGGAIKVKSHNLSFINSIFSPGIARTTLWTGEYFIYHRYSQTEKISAVVGRPGLWLIDQRGTDGVPAVVFPLLNNTWTLIDLINSIPTFQTYDYGLITWNQMHYQTSDPLGMNYVESMYISEVRLEGASCQSFWNKDYYSWGDDHNIPLDPDIYNTSTPMHFEIDTLKLFIGKH